MSRRKISHPHQHGQPQNISYSVVHTIPGRIRFRIPRLGKDTEYATRLQQAIELYIEGTKVRVNRTAASIVINYQTSLVSDEKVRSQLIQLIQTAPEINLPKPVTIKSTVSAIFDALSNLINSVRNLNQARNTIKYRRYRVDTWERLLSTGQRVIKGLKSTLMFLLPGRQSQSPTALESA
jgi:hypothetical protein